jgi:hypothetical protein
MRERYAYFSNDKQVHHDENRDRDTKQPRESVFYWTQKSKGWANATSGALDPVALHAPRIAYSPCEVEAVLTRVTVYSRRPLKANTRHALACSAG